MAIRKSNQITFTEQKKIVEIKEWYLATNLDADVTRDTDGWTESVQQADAVNRYLWNYEEVVYSIGESEKSLPVIIGTYGSVSDIVNYYAITENLIPPDPNGSAWETDFSKISEKLSSENKYLWNYEIIIYADGSTSEPHPAIIGVYGDSGKDAISFKIYSPDGFEFIDDVDEENRLETITLQLSSFKGNEPLTGCVYTWYWWNPNYIAYEEVEVTAETTGEYWIFENETFVPKMLPNDYVSDITYYTTKEEAKYIEILTTTNTFFEVNINDEYAFANLKCEMTFDENDGDTYIDYVTLTKRVDIYNASINFFEGMNVFSPGKDYLVAYVELYKNGKIEETLQTTNYYSEPVVLYAVDESVNETTVGIYYILENNAYIQKNLPDDGYDSTEIYYMRVSNNELNNNKIIIETTYKPELYIEATSIDETTYGEYYVLEDGEYVKKNLPDDGYDETLTYYVYTGYDMNDEFLSYFIYSTEGDYNIVLGGYNFESEQWSVVDRSTKYVYTSNSTTLDEISNIFVISKSDIVRSKDVSVYVYKNILQEIDEEIVNENSFIATTKATIVDLNDTIVSGSEPENPYEGQLWLDTDTNTLHVYTNGEWSESIKQADGKAVYTSQPASYKAGDLWVVEKDFEFYIEASVTSETAGEYFIKQDEEFVSVTLPDNYDENVIYYTSVKFDEGALLRATDDSMEFNASHWNDAMLAVTQTVNNVAQYFGFSIEDGLRIGQTDNKFYVNINARRMGFYYDGDIEKEEVNTELGDNEVVYIGTNSARIRNLVVEGSADFNSEITVDSQISIVNIHGTETTNAGFNFRIEPNGSLSLVRVEVE